MGRAHDSVQSRTRCAAHAHPAIARPDDLHRRWTLQLQSRRGSALEPTSQMWPTISYIRCCVLLWTHTYPLRKVQNQAAVSTIITTVVTQATPLNKREFTYSPIRSFLLISSSMKIRTNGRTIPFTTCERIAILTSGKPGIRTTAPPATISRVYSQ